MNKLFTLHSSITYRDNNRQYFMTKWEPIMVSTYMGDTLPPFQYKRTANRYFYAAQYVTSEVDITDRFRSATELITSWTTPVATMVYTSSDYNITALTFTSDYPTATSTSNNFTLSANDKLNFRVDGTFSGGGDIVHVKFYKGATLLDTMVLANGKNELATPVTAGGTDYKIVFESVTIVGANSIFSDADYSCRKCLFDIHNNYVTYYGGDLEAMSTLTLPTSSGSCYFIFQSSNKFYTDDCYLTASTSEIDSNLEIQISSSVDYADIYYKGGFIQKLYRKGNVRRSPQPKITVIGEERNGILVKEKVISATHYTCRIRVTEAIYDALITGVGANVTITDQTGKVFTCNNLEVEKADWYGTNGLCTLSFDDNVNVFTNNSSDL